MEAAVLNPVLIRILLLALHLMPVEEVSFPLHVLEAGLYAGTYRVQRTGSEHAFFRTPQDDTKILPFEAERSRRHGQFYTVYVPEKGETLSVGLTEELKELKLLKAGVHQSIGGEKTALRVDVEGRIAFFAAEADQLTVVMELPVSK